MVSPKWSQVLHEPSDLRSRRKPALDPSRRHICRTNTMTFRSARSLFAFSMKSNILGGNLIWVVLALVATLGCAAAFRLPSDRPAVCSESELESSDDSDSDPR